MTAYAPRAAVEEAIEEWSRAVLTCRLNKHDFTVGHTATEVKGGYDVVVRCRRKCGVMRRFFMDRQGFIEDSRPIYPKEGYLLRGLGRIDRNGMAAIRLAFLANMKVIQAPADDVVVPIKGRRRAG